MFYQGLSWIIERLPEIIATLTGLLYIIYSVERNTIAWPYGIVSSAIYVYVFYKAGIFADMSVYVYYVLVGFYGWYNWSRDTQSDKRVIITKTGVKQGLFLFFVTVFLFFLIGFILKKYTSSNIPYWDAFTTSLSITATWMLTRKIIEHWLLWIIVDSVSIGLYLYKDLYPSVVLFTVYTLLAVAGYYDWLKEWKKQEQTVSLK